MPHEIDRVIRAAAQGVWLIDERKGRQIMAALALRAEGLPRAFDSADRPREMAATQVVEGKAGPVHILRVMGTIMPRANVMADFSGGTSMQVFQREFRAAAADTAAAAIIIEFDSPGGLVDLVPESAAMIRAARRSDRPVVAVANTMAASAAYYLAAACDEIVVTPSGMVGSIGVYMVHDDHSEAMAQRGIRTTYIYEGPRKVEGNSDTPLDDVARAAFQAEVRETYNTFTADVARFRGVPVSTVRADPEVSDSHFGGGRAYHAREAVRLGMADTVATFDDTVLRVANGGRGRPRRASVARRRLSMM